MTSKPSNHRLITTDRVTGTPVFNRGGERIGHIDNLSINKTSGQVIYALLSFGGFLGIGERFHPLPWKVLDYDPTKEGYVVPLEKAQLEAAPTYTKDELEAFGAGDQSYRDRLFDFYGAYGAAPYW
jgi:hypothetical protein